LQQKAGGEDENKVDTENVSTIFKSCRPLQFKIDWLVSFQIFAVPDTGLNAVKSQGNNQKVRYCMRAEE
jgi:hypothetical protein